MSSFVFLLPRLQMLRECALKMKYGSLHLAYGTDKPLKLKGDNWLIVYLLVNHHLWTRNRLCHMQ